MYAKLSTFKLIDSLTRLVPVVIYFICYLFFKPLLISIDIIKLNKVKARDSYISSIQWMVLSVYCCDLITASLLKINWKILKKKKKLSLLL